MQPGRGFDSEARPEDQPQVAAMQAAMGGGPMPVVKAGPGVGDWRE
jgi:hypothetical protein